MKLEKAINPLLDENDIVGFTFILSQIVEKLRAIPTSWPFHNPVNRKFVKNYYDLIKNPISLKDIEEKIKVTLFEQRYSDRYNYALPMRNIFMIILSLPDHHFPLRRKSIIGGINSSTTFNSSQLIPSSSTAPTPSSRRRPTKSWTRARNSSPKMNVISASWRAQCRYVSQSCTATVVLESRLNY